VIKRRSSETHVGSWLLALSCLVTLGACPSKSSSGGGSAGMGGGSGATFTEIYSTLFPATTAPRCNFCHGMPPSAISNGNLTVGMDQKSAYAGLVGKTSMDPRCMGMSLVTPGKPETSLFYLKVAATPPCGDRMPLGGSPLSDAQIEMIRSWIAAGAKDD